MELHEIALKSSGWVWDRLREARYHNYQIGEESLTDFVILNLKKHGKGKLIVNTFTRRKEALTGADWEWWLNGPSGKWLGMRVQAKVINLKNTTFEHLHYKNKHGYQVDSLLKDASKHSLIPLYCMYTNWDPKKFSPMSKCLSPNKSVRFFGTSIMKPDDVKKLRPTNDLKNAIVHLRPLPCIFCCSGHGGMDLPTKAFEYAKVTGLITADNSDKTNISEYLKDEPPYYVQQILQNEVSNGIIDIDDSNLKRITVIKEINHT